MEISSYRTVVGIWSTGVHSQCRRSSGVWRQMGAGVLGDHCVNYTSVRLTAVLVPEIRIK